MTAASGCPACGAALETPLGCSSCGVLLRPEIEPNPFEVFGLEPSWSVDKEDLKARLRRFGRIVHPDYHGTSPRGARELAEASSARLNGAYEILLDDFLRADWLVRHLGGPSDSEERAMPREFLMEVLEWNEALDEAESAAPDSPARAALERLARSLLAEHAALPDPGDPVLAEIRRELNGVRYLSRALLRIRDMRFGTPSR